MSNDPITQETPPAEVQQQEEKTTLLTDPPKQEETGDNPLEPEADTGDNPPVDGDNDKPNIPESPDKYVLEFGKDFPVDNAKLDSFKAECHKMGMTQEQAQGIAKLYESELAGGQQAYNQAIEKQELEWRKQCETHPDFGGAKYNESMKNATLVMEKFATPEFRQIINTGGFGSHPEVVGFMVRIGSAMAEKEIIGTSNQSTQSVAERRYPSMAKN